MPPWLCMKQENFTLPMLILGPELNELWEIRVETFDESTRKNFSLHVSLLWNINDFPAYENLSG